MKKNTRKFLFAGLGAAVLIAGIVLYELMSTTGRTQVQINILQNKELIHQSTFAEPPQFAIWLEDADSHKCQTVFVTHRAGIGDWEGKSNVPVALPRWFELFKVKGKEQKEAKTEYPLTVTGATPKQDYFSIRAEVKPGTHWICWVEMNLAGDFNDAFPEHSSENKQIDEFSNGQPALLYKGEITAIEGSKFQFKLEGQSLWENGETKIEPVSDGITTAKNVFEKMDIEIIRPKPKLIGKNNLESLAAKN
jgi:hypothetical protein